VNTDSATNPADAVPLWPVCEADWPTLREQLPPSAARWLDAQQFRGERHRALAWPDGDGRPAGAVLGLGAANLVAGLDPWLAAGAPERLPAADYVLAGAVDAGVATQLHLGWRLGAYALNSYKSEPKPQRLARLLPSAGADLQYVQAAAAAMALARDLINTPANLLGPAELAAAAAALAARTGGSCELIQGPALMAGFPLIAAVGQGSARAPCLIDCRWPRPGAPRVTLVGKGVCFDSGGLDLKPAAGMLLMKKDMGGAACTLGLAQLLRELEVPVQLRVLIPAAENAVGGNAFRPGDVWPSRKGLRVEIGNTDAEGRLVLADALAEAAADSPDLLIDLATLTGAARTALGPELPAVFSNREPLLQALRAAGERTADPVWPLPLWAGYDDELSSRVGDLNNVSNGAFAGAIIGALFLQRFVPARTDWIHIDLYAWNAKDRPGRPAGAEAQCLRAVLALLRERYGR
jgi:leucyl aminopeptidase